METQKTPNSQSSLEKEEWNWRNQPDYATKLQSSRQYGTGTKTEIQTIWNKTESPEINPCTYRYLIFDKKGKTKRASSINGPGKMRQLHVKE